MKFLIMFFLLLIPTNLFSKDFISPPDSQIIAVEKNIINTRNISFYYDIPDEKGVVDGIWDVVVYYPLIEEGISVKDLSSETDKIYEVCSDYKPFLFINEFKKYNSSRQIIDDSVEYVFDRNLVSDEIVITLKPSENKILKLEVCSVIIDKTDHWLVYNEGNEVYYIKKGFTGYRYYSVNESGVINTVEKTFVETPFDTTGKYYDNELMDMSDVK